MATHLAFNLPDGGVTSITMDIVRDISQKLDALATFLSQKV